MRALAILAVLLAIGCAKMRIDSAHIKGPIAPPPTGSHVSAGDAKAVADQSNARANGDKKAEAAARVEQDALNRAEIRGDMRLVISLGVLVLAIGAALLKYGATGLGSAIACGGGALIGGAMFVTAIVPHMVAIAYVAAASAGIVFLIRHRNLFHAARGAATNGEHKLGTGAKRILSRFRAELPAVSLKVPPPAPPPPNVTTP
jgi:hypothetical protein